MVSFFRRNRGANKKETTRTTTEDDHPAHPIPKEIQYSPQIISFKSIAQLDDSIEEITNQLKALKETNARSQLEHEYEREQITCQQESLQSKVKSKLGWSNSAGEAAPPSSLHPYLQAVRSVDAPQFVQGLQSKLCQKLHQAGVLKHQLELAEASLKSQHGLTGFTKQQMNQLTDENTVFTVTKLNQLSAASTELQQTQKEWQYKLDQQHLELQQLRSEEAARIMLLEMHEQNSSSSTTNINSTTPPSPPSTKPPPPPPQHQHQLDSILKDSGTEATQPPSPFGSPPPQRSLFGDDDFDGEEDEDYRRLMIERSISDSPTLRIGKFTIILS